nr:hypothetical protein [Roseomonas sp. SXEYE001]
MTDPITEGVLNHFGYLPPESRRMEVCIGASDALNQGHGARIAWQHVDDLLGLCVPAVGIESHPSNERAHRVFPCRLRDRGETLDVWWSRVM